MGRDAQAQVQFAGQTGAVRAVLESDALILRGDLRLRIPRDDIRGWQAAGAALHLQTAQGALVLTMAEPAEAGRWLRALNRPVPTLAEKLGVKGAALWAMTDVDDPTLAAAIADCLRATDATATLGLAIIRSGQDLAFLLALCAENPHLPVWVINEKGKASRCPESTIRTSLRAAGMVDLKSCAISPTLSGTRYQRRKA